MINRLMSSQFEGCDILKVKYGTIEGQIIFKIFDL